jgi:hypothetical protein
MFSRPSNEGGLDIPPAKIEFDDKNAKAAVSKGACLLHVMRDTLVGYEVDIADFKARLLADIFYLQVDGSRRNLFESGAIDDFDYVEESTDGRAFPEFLSLYYGSDDEIIGQFHFSGACESLPEHPTIDATTSPETTISTRFLTTASTARSSSGWKPRSLASSDSIPGRTFSRVFTE